MSAKISLIDLVNALEATGRGLRWTVDLATGDILPVDELAAPPPESARYRPLPARHELPDDELRGRFCATVGDAELRSALADGMRDATGRAFETAVRKLGVHDDWIAHRRAGLVEVALGWVAAEGVRCRRDLSAASISS